MSRSPGQAAVTWRSKQVLWKVWSQLDSLTMVLAPPSSMQMPHSTSSPVSIGRRQNAGRLGSFMWVAWRGGSGDEKDDDDDDDDGEPVIAVPDEDEEDEEEEEGDGDDFEQLVAVLDEEEDSESVSERHEATRCGGNSISLIGVHRQPSARAGLLEARIPGISPRGLEGATLAAGQRLGDLGAMRGSTSSESGWSKARVTVVIAVGLK